MTHRGGNSIISIALFLTAACGSSQQTPGAHAPTPVAPPTDAAPAAPTAAALPPCPANDALVSRLEALWKPDPATIKIQSCTPGHFPAPAWLVIAFVDTYEAGDEPDMPSASELRRIVLSADAVIAQAKPETLAPWYRAEGAGPTRLHLADLDGDGSDELIEEWFMAHGGSSGTMLVVRRLAPPNMVKLMEREIDSNPSTDEGYDSTAPRSWDTEVSVRPAPSGKGSELVLTTTWDAGKPEEGELGPGTHIFRLSGDSLSEQAH